MDEDATTRPDQEDATTRADQLRAGKTITTFAHGTSMEPLLHDGTTSMLIEPVQGDLEVGDLPFIQRRNGKQIVHRIVEVEDGHYRTRGDNCEHTERVRKAAVLGVVTEINRDGKTIHMSDPGYRAYVHVWSATAPMRMCLKRLRSGASHIKARLSGHGSAEPSTTTLGADTTSTGKNATK